MCKEGFKPFTLSQYAPERLLQEDEVEGSSYIILVRPSPCFWLARCGWLALLLITITFLLAYSEGFSDFKSNCI